MTFRRSYYPGGALTRPVWATARSLATTCAIVVYFLFLRVLRCFSSPRSPHDYMVSPSPVTGFPIRTSAGRRAFAAHRRFSQLVTSFVASESHRHPPCALVRFSFIFTANSPFTEESPSLVDYKTLGFSLDSRLWMTPKGHPSVNLL